MCSEYTKLCHFFPSSQTDGHQNLFNKSGFHKLNWQYYCIRVTRAPVHFFSFHGVFWKKWAKIIAPQLCPIPRLRNLNPPLVIRSRNFWVFNPALCNIFTGHNEVVAKVMFLLVSVILLTGGGGCYCSMHCRWYPSIPCSRSLGGASSQRGQGAWSRGGCMLLGGRGCLVQRGGLLLGEEGLCGLLLWPSVMDFWHGLLVWPSGKAFWYWGVSPNRDPFQPEGHNRRPYQNGLLVWPSGKAFWCDLLLWPSGVVAFCYGLLVERGVSVSLCWCQSLRLAL